MREENSIRPVWIWEATGAIVGFVGAILSLLFGGLFTVGSWISGAHANLWLQRFGTGLLIAAIPLLLFAGHCLDLMEKTTPAPRESSEKPGD